MGTSIQLQIQQSALEDSTDRFQPIVIWLNVAALGSIWLIHFAFSPFVPDFKGTLVGTLMLLRIAEQIGEGLYLTRNSAPEGTFRTRIYPHFSIWTNLALAALFSISSNTDEAHYIVLLAIPVVSAAFTYSLGGVLCVSALASGLLFFELWLFYVLHPGDVLTHRPMEHRFELGTMALVLPVLGVFVWLLVRRLRQDQVELSAAFAEIQRTHRQLAQEERLADIGRLSSVLSHEIRNPVSTIVSAIRIARGKEERKEDPAEFYDLAMNESKRLENLTNDILLFAKPLTLRAQRSSPKSVLEYVAEIVRASTGGAHASVALVCSDEHESDFDVTHIQRALLNLAMNATAHSPAGSAVVLGADKHSDGVDFYVENPGDPIPNDAAKRIFEPFFTTREGGSGLGLSISRKIAELHGGSLELTVNEPGRVRFVLRIPGQLLEAQAHG